MPTWTREKIIDIVEAFNEISTRFCPDEFDIGGMCNGCCDVDKDCEKCWVEELKKYYKRSSK